MKKTVSIFQVFIFTIVFCVCPLTHSANTEASAKNCDDISDPDDKKECLKRELAAGVDESKQNLGNTSRDMTDSGAGGGDGGGGGMGPLAGILGGAAAGFGAAAIMGNKAKNDAEKKLAQAKAEVDAKFKEAEKKQQEEIEKFRAEIDEKVNSASAGTDIADAPSLGGAGVVGEIEAAIASGNTAQVQQLIASNRDQLPDSYITDVESRLGLSFSGSSSSESSAVASLQSAAPPSGGLSINEVIQADMVDEARDLVAALLAEGKVNEASQAIALLEVSNNSRMANLASEMKPRLNAALQALGLPSGDLGLALHQ